MSSIVNFLDANARNLCKQQKQRDSKNNNKANHKKTKSSSFSLPAERSVRALRTSIARRHRAPCNAAARRPTPPTAPADRCNRRPERHQTSSSMSSMLLSTVLAAVVSTNRADDTTRDARTAPRCARHCARAAQRSTLFEPKHVSTKNVKQNKSRKRDDDVHTAMSVSTTSAPIAAAASPHKPTPVANVYREINAPIAHLPLPTSRTRFVATSSGCASRYRAKNVAPVCSTNVSLDVCNDL